MCECVRVCMFMGEGLWVYACVWVQGCGCGCVNVCMWVYVGVYVCITGVGGSKKRAFRISSIYWGKLVPQGNNNRNTKNTKNFLTRSWLYTGMNISETPTMEPIFQIELSELKRL